jgi:uncharacterized protein (TIGR02246 family)
MKRLIAALVCVTALATAIVPARAQPPVPGDTTAAVAATAAWVEAFNSRDPKRIVALYAPDAVLWGTTATTIATTPDAIWAYFKDAGQRPWTRVAVDAQHARVLGTIAIASGSYTFSDVREGVATNVRPARFTFVFRRDGDRWLIVEHHSSRVPDP